MDFLKKLKSILENKNKKKLIENTVIIVIIGIIIILAGGAFFKKSNNSGSSINSQTTDESLKAIETMKNLSTETNDLEKRLKAILTLMNGVGNVDVMITYSSSKESIPAYDIKKNENTTNEKDSGGGTRSISQSEYDSAVVYEDNQNGGKTPVITKEIQPVVKGVVVVADGASNPQVREEVIKAVQVLMDVPSHKIQVVGRKK